MRRLEMDDGEPVGLHIGGAGRSGEEERHSDEVVPINCHFHASAFIAGDCGGSLRDHAVAAASIKSCIFYSVGNACGMRDACNHISHAAH